MNNEKNWNIELGVRLGIVLFHLGTCVGLAVEAKTSSTAPTLPDMRPLHLQIKQDPNRGGRVE